MEIENAKKILRENNYLVIKFTKDMKFDIKDCIDKGIDKECSDCSCDICLARYVDSEDGNED